MRKLAADSIKGTIAVAGKYSKSKIVALKNDANINLKNARGQIVSKHGVLSLFKGQFWILTVTQITISNFVPILLSILICGIILGSWLFGIASVVYLVFFLKSVVCILINLILTIGNTIWFSFNALAQLIVTAFLDIINGFANLITAPIYSALEFLWGVFGIPDAPHYKPLGEGIWMIKLNPSHGFSYVVPTAPVTTSGAISFGSVFGIVYIQPGHNPYTGEFTAVYQQNGATLYFPEINEDAVSEDGDGDGEPDFWTPLDRPPDVPDDYTYIFDREKSDITVIDFIFNLADWVKNIIGGILGIGEEERMPDNWHELLVNPDSFPESEMTKSVIQVWHEELENRRDWFASVAFQNNVFGEYLRYYDLVLNYVAANLEQENFYFKPKDKYMGIGDTRIKTFVSQFMDERMSWW